MASESCEDNVKRFWAGNANSAWNLKDMHKNYPGSEYDARVSDFCKCYALSNQDEYSRLFCVGKSRIYNVLTI